MFRPVVSSLSLLAALVLTSLTGCAATAVTEGEDVSSDALAKTAIESFKLYARPGVVPSLDCDVHTELTLSGVATLREVVGGVCEIYVEPNERSYRLEVAGTDCGSVIYSGKASRGGKAISVTITDHRGRTCRDVREADIVVEETGVVEGAVQRLFSL
jgi:hypothetical protein